MIKADIDIVPTLKAAIISLVNYELTPLIVNGQIGLVSPNGSRHKEKRNTLYNDDHTLVGFFSSERVQALIGPTTLYAEQINKCQLADDGYCNHNLKTRRTAEGAIRLRWHHDNLADDNPKAFTIARLNSVHHGLRQVSMQLHGVDTPLTDSDLCWWAVRHNVFHLLPQSVLDRQFKRKPNFIKNGILGNKDTDARYNPESQVEQLKRLAKPVLTLSIDPEPPALHMRKPKPLHWKNEAYLDFVSKLPCSVCGEKSQYAQHLTGKGENKMGVAPDDLFVFPLCDKHGTDLIESVFSWELEHGSQLLHVTKTLKAAIAMGAIQ